MNLDFIMQLYIPIVMAACLVIGFVVKKWVKDVDNRWIPTICCVAGMILACVYQQGVTMQTLVAGAVTGLASTGLHQAFKQIMEGNKK